MKKTAILTIFAIIAIYFFLDSRDPSPYHSTEENSSPKIPRESFKTLKIEKSTVANIVGKSKSYLEKQLGPPDRIEPSMYGYDWYVYSGSEQQYFQAGVKDDEVVTAYVAGSEVPVKPFTIGQSVPSILKNVQVKSEVTVKRENNFFRFELSEEEMNIRPLIQIDDIYAQLYFDKFTQKLSSIRYLNKDMLLLQRPYSVVYRGTLSDPPKVGKDKQRSIEEAQERQILDITNVVRVKHQLKPLTWDEPTAKVAYGHSKEMAELNYFSHTSPKSGDLADRLGAGNVKYQEAGENIAAKYTDGAAAVEGWLNSRGHRDALLNENYTRLGVGVFKNYYTQNFIKPW